MKHSKQTQYLQDELALAEAWQRFKSTGDQMAREALLLHHLPLVKFLVGRLGIGLPGNVDEADLISFGVFGLLDAMDRFDPERGYRFEPWAGRRIRKAIFDELRLAFDGVPETGLGSTMIAVDRIQANTREPRRQFDNVALASLAASIVEVGVLVPIVVREIDDGYLLVAGEQRWRAAKMAGLAVMPAIVSEGEVRSLLAEALIENLQREHRNPLKDFAAFQQRREDFAAFQQLPDDFGVIQEEIGRRVGRSRSALAKAIRLLQLPAAHQGMLERGEISAGHVLALLMIEDRADAEHLAERAAREGWAVRRVEEATRRPMGMEIVAIVDVFFNRLASHADELGSVNAEEAGILGTTAADDVLAAVRWSSVVGDRIDTSEATRLLGLTRQALAKRQRSGSLLGLPGNRTTWFPTWQFDLVAKRIRPEVRELVGAFRDRLSDVDPFVIAAWAWTPQEEDLGGQTPAQLLLDGGDMVPLRRAAERAAARLAQ